MISSKHFDFNDEEFLTDFTDSIAPPGSIPKEFNPLDDIELKDMGIRSKPCETKTFDLEEDFTPPPSEQSSPVAKNITIEKEPVAALDVPKPQEIPAEEPAPLVEENESMAVFHEEPDNLQVVSQKLESPKTQNIPVAQELREVKVIPAQIEVVVDRIETNSEPVQSTQLTAEPIQTAISSGFPKPKKPKNSFCDKLAQLFQCCICCGGDNEKPTQKIA